MKIIIKLKMELVKRLYTQFDIISGIKESLNYLENGKSLIINLGGSKGFSVKQNNQIL